MLPVRPPAKRPGWLGGLKPPWRPALAASLLLLVGVWLFAGLPGDRVAQREQSPRAPIKVTATAGQNSQAVPSEQALPTVEDSDWEMYFNEDPDTILVDMASGLDRRALDRLLSEI